MAFSSTVQRTERLLLRRARASARRARARPLRRRGRSNGGHRGERARSRPRTSTPWWRGGWRPASRRWRGAPRCSSRRSSRASPRCWRGRRGGRVRSGGCVRRGSRTATGSPRSSSAGTARGGRRRARRWPARVARAIALYEAFAEQRPPGWPASGPGALCALAAPAARRRASPATSRGCCAWPRGCARPRSSSDPDAPAARRARAAAPPGARGRLRFVFRRARRAARRAEQRRQRVRDALLLAGAEPGGVAERRAGARARCPSCAGAPQPRLLEPDRFDELDGLGARAARYRAELARGRWQLPHDLHRPPPPNPGGITR